MSNIQTIRRSPSKTMHKKIETRSDFAPIGQLSSCDCYSCKNNFYMLDKQIEKNCNISPYFECSNRLTFKNQIEPCNKSGYDIINPQVMVDNYAPEFRETKCDDELKKSCSVNIYTSDDPRLISGGHNGQVLDLDRPAIDPNIKLCEIYDEKLKNYGQKYKNYSDIREGDIMYYYDRSIEDSLFQPIFENPSNVESKLYKDPMASIAYPEYIRNPVYKSNLLKTKNRDYRYNLSSIDDQNEFREDIIHLQMRPQDRSKYSARWTGNRIY